MRFPDVLVRHVSEPLWDFYEHSVRLSTLRQLRRSQFDEPEQIRDRQEQRLALLVRHATATCPLQKNRFADAGIDPDGVHTPEDLRKLPPMDTSMVVRSHLAGLLSTAWRREELTTTGRLAADGIAVSLCCDQRGIELRHAANMRADEWCGWKMGQPIAVVGHGPPALATLKSRIRARFKDRFLYLDARKLDRPAIDRFCAGWRELRPTLLSGPASMLRVLAEDLLSRGHELRPVAIVVTDAHLQRADRAFIEMVFSARVHHQYRRDEVGLIGCECEVRDGLHLNAENMIVEFVRQDDTPCSPGERGRIVVTELINLGLPMIRYDTGHWGQPADRACACGRRLPLLTSLSVATGSDCT